MGGNHTRQAPDLLQGLWRVVLASANTDLACEFVTVGYPGNAADSTGYGRVDYHC